MAAVIFIVYPLSFGPACKLYVQGPNFPGKFRVFEFTYHPLITLLNRSRYSTLDNFFYWYLTEVWQIPLFRN